MREHQLLLLVQVLMLLLLLLLQRLLLLQLLLLGQEPRLRPAPLPHEWARARAGPQLRHWSSRHGSHRHRRQHRGGC